MDHVDEESKPLKDLDIVTIKKHSASITIMCVWGEPVHVKTPHLKLS